MRRYAYKKLSEPSEKQLNELGEEGWRVVNMAMVAMGEYGSRTYTAVLMERYEGPPDPSEGRL